MFAKWIANQLKHPSGFAGKIVGKLLEKGNVQANLKTIESLEITDNDTVLEIGFGPGAALNQILTMNGKCIVKGIDFSEVMHEKARKKNCDFITEGRLELIKGDFRTADLKNDGYNKIFGVNVIYFWEDVKAAAEKLLKILKVNGKVAFFMSDKKDLERVGITRTDVFNKYDIDQVENTFRNAGFSNVRHTEFKTKFRTAYILQAQKD